MKSNKIIISEYKEWLSQIKQKFQSSQIKASIQVNSTLLEFFIGIQEMRLQKNRKIALGEVDFYSMSNEVKKQAVKLIKKLPSET